MPDTEQVCNATDGQRPTSQKMFLMPTQFWDKLQFVMKLFETLLSFLAFILEEVVTTCSSCSPLYFFEFVSCTAFLFTCLLLVLLFTALRHKVGIECWPAVDFLYTGLIAILFLIATIVFHSDNGGTSLEISAVAFGFLASLAFIVDIGIFIKINGVPFIKKGPQASGGDQATSSEEEKLRDRGRE